MGPVIKLDIIKFPELWTCATSGVLILDRRSKMGLTTTGVNSKLLLHYAERGRGL
jgi:hypothetical protein